MRTVSFTKTKFYFNVLLPVGAVIYLVWMTIGMHTGKSPHLLALAAASILGIVMNHAKKYDEESKEAPVIIMALFSYLILFGIIPMILF